MLPKIAMPGVQHRNSTHVLNGCGQTPKLGKMHGQHVSFPSPCWQNVTVFGREGTGISEISEICGHCLEAQKSFDLT